MWRRRSWFSLKGKVGIRGSAGEPPCYSSPAPGATGRIRATTQLQPLLPVGVDLDCASDRCLPDPLGAQQVQAPASAAQRCKRLAGAGHPRQPASVCALALSAWEWPNIGSRMTRECHVRFWERVGVRLPRATRQVCLRIGGQKHWLWRAVDQDGVVLDVLVQKRRDKKAAKRLLRKLPKKQARVPRVMVTDKLASYGAAKGEVMPSVEHRKHKGLNNRAENSHQ